RHDALRGLAVRPDLDMLREKPGTEAGLLRNPAQGPLDHRWKLGRAASDLEGTHRRGELAQLLVRIRVQHYRLAPRERLVDDRAGPADQHGRAPEQVVDVREPTSGWRFRVCRMLAECRRNARLPACRQN